MSIAGQVETAFSFLEVLQQTERERDELKEYMDDHPVPEQVLSGWADTAKVLLIANAIWVRRLIDSDMLATIESYLKAAPLHVRRNAYAGTVTLATPGLFNGLRDKVATERRNMEQNAGGQFSTVGPETYREMIAEGIVDWAVRTGADDGYEIRRCPQCDKWFEPQMKARGRFCSDKCRKTFNNRRNSADESLTTFVCQGCEETRTMDEFAGLRFEDEEGKTATPLRMGYYGYMGGDDGICCVHCVRNKYPEWRRYIAPMESLSERASA
jgi:hypothetical protein